MFRRWLVAPDTAGPLGRFLASQGVDAQALAAGRVFVNGQRQREPHATLAPGDEVSVSEARTRSAHALILAERDGIVAASKPALLSTEPDRAGTSSLTEQLSAQLGSRVHAISRLDLGVSGVVLVSTSAAATRRCLDAQAAGELRRGYIGWCGAAPTPAEGTWQGAIGRARAGRRQIGGASAKAATTHYRTLCTATRGAVLALLPVTGRTHQLRVHAAAARSPLLGDRLYAGARRLTDSEGRVLELGRVGLHAAWVSVRLGADVWTVVCELPPELIDWWEALGGNGAQLRYAVAGFTP